MSESVFDGFSEGVDDSGSACIVDANERNPEFDAPPPRHFHMLYGSKGISEPSVICGVEYPFGFIFVCVEVGE